jgi:cell division septum initiation protein DivIVA
VASGEPLEPQSSQAEGDPAASPDAGGDLAERGSDSAELRDVSFPWAVRGYDRGAVDAYVKRAQNLVAELELTRSPEAAVRHALANVGEQTKGVLERAGETAEQITLAARHEAEESTVRARSEAEELVAKAKAEAAEIVSSAKVDAEASVAQAQNEAGEHLQRTEEEIATLRDEAEARMRELGADTDTIRQERSRLLDDIRELATRVGEVAGAADARVPPPTTAQQGHEGESEAEPGTSGATQETKVEATDGSTR